MRNSEDLIRARLWPGWKREPVQSTPQHHTSRRIIAPMSGALVHGFAEWYNHSMNGASGIPLQGREFEYATELWLEGPAAFWLHPEGPLSDTTPEEYLAKQRANVAAQHKPVHLMQNMQPNYASQLAALQSYGALNQRSGLGYTGAGGLGLASLLGRL